MNEATVMAPSRAVQSIQVEWKCPPSTLHDIIHSTFSLHDGSHPHPPHPSNHHPTTVSITWNNPREDGLLDRLGRLGSRRTPRATQRSVADGAGVGAAEGAPAVESAGAPETERTVGWGRDPSLGSNSFPVVSFEETNCHLQRMGDKHLVARVDDI